MGNKKGFTVIEILIVILFLFVFVPWIWNGVKFSSCDFESNYKCEVIHGAGVLIPPASLITVWFGDDKA